MNTKLATKALEVYDGGACNPRAMARLLVECLDDAAGQDRKGPDFAHARVMLTQLSWVLGFRGDGLGGYTVAGVEQDSADLAMLRALTGADPKS